MPVRSVLAQNPDQKKVRRAARKSASAACREEIQKMALVAFVIAATDPRIRRTDCCVKQPVPKSIEGGRGPRSPLYFPVIKL